MKEMITSRAHISQSAKGQRNKNEDVYYPVNGESNANLFFVCDGLGGHGDGDLAAAFVQLDLPEIIFKQSEFSTWDLEEALLETNDNLKRYAQQVGNLQMGCTVAALQFDEEDALVAWVGDSRVYHIRNGEILFKTKDHTLVELMIDNGELSPEEAFKFPMKHIIYQALGPKNKTLKPSTERLQNVLPGDLFLLATDGVFEAWTEQDLVNIISQNGFNSAALIENRCAFQSKDNYTFTIIKV